MHGRVQDWVHTQQAMPANREKKHWRSDVPSLQQPCRTIPSPAAASASLPGDSGPAHISLVDDYTQKPRQHCQRSYQDGIAAWLPSGYFVFAPCLIAHSLTPLMCRPRSPLWFVGFFWRHCRSSIRGTCVVQRKSCLHALRLLAVSRHPPCPHRACYALTRCASLHAPLLPCVGFAGVDWACINHVFSRTCFAFYDSYCSQKILCFTTTFCVRLSRSADAVCHSFCAHADDAFQHENCWVYGCHVLPCSLWPFATQGVFDSVRMDQQACNFVALGHCSRLPFTGQADTVPHTAAVQPGSGLRRGSVFSLADALCGNLDLYVGQSCLGRFWHSACPDCLSGLSMHSVGLRSAMCKAPLGPQLSGFVDSVLVPCADVPSQLHADVSPASVVLPAPAFDRDSTYVYPCLEAFTRSFLALQLLSFFRLIMFALPRRSHCERSNQGIHLGRTFSRGAPFCLCLALCCVAALGAPTNDGARHLPCAGLSSADAESSATAGLPDVAPGRPCTRPAASSISADIASRSSPEHPSEARSDCGHDSDIDQKRFWSFPIKICSISGQPF